jgi:SAM-dependent methyltransferase
MDIIEVNLNSSSPAYSQDFPYYLDNDLILNWYPQRIIAKTVPDSNALELGLGHGFSTTHFAKYYRNHFVLDGADEIIEQFSKNFPTCAAVIIETYFEEFVTSLQFDVIIMGFVLEHVDDPKAILLQYRQFLKPGGKLYVTVPNVEALNKRIGYEMGLINDLFALGPGDIALGHKQLFSVNTLRELVNECGYRELSLEGLFLKPLTTSQLKALNLPSEAFNAMMRLGVNYPELSVGLLMELELK